MSYAPWEPPTSPGGPYVVALDIETTGLDPFNDQITCVGIYHPSFSYVMRSKDELERTLDYLGDYGFVGQNFGFDLKFLLHQWGMDLRDRWLGDTQLMAYTLTEKIPGGWLADYEKKRLEVNKRDKVTHRKAGKHSLKTLAPYFLGVDPFWETPDNHDNDEYVLKDCKYTYELFGVLADKLKERGQFAFYKSRMMPWAQMCLDMEINGMPVDTKVINETRVKLLTEADENQVELDKMWQPHYDFYEALQLREIVGKYDAMMHRAIDKLKDKTKISATVDRYNNLCDNAASKIDVKINLDSPKQKLWLFRDRLGLDCTDFQGKESTGAPVIRKYADQGREDLQLYLKIQENKKLANFCDQWLDQQIDGRIHANFNLARTNTGRLSSSEPNLQQVSSKLYPCFKAKSGKKLLSYDMAAIEAVLIAYYSDDPVLYDILTTGQSIHCYNTAKVFFPHLGLEPHEVKEKAARERRISKEIGFALFYNAGVGRIKASFEKYGEYPSESQCREMLESFRRNYSVAYKYAQGVVRAFERGEVLTNLLGRPLAIENRDDAYMKGFNKLIQSSASDLVVLAADKASRHWEDCKLVALVHDAIIAESSDEYAQEAAEILVDAMTSFKLTTANGPIILQAEGAISSEWSK